MFTGFLLFFCYLYYSQLNVKCFYNEKYQVYFIFKIKENRTKQFSTLQKSTFFTLNDSFLLVSETPMVMTLHTDSTGGGRQSQGFLQAKKHFCLNYLYLSDKIVFCSGIIQMAASFIFPLTLHVQV
jgi:hypothetical protein